MINFILQPIEELTLTHTSLTLGYNPGNTLPPRVLVLWPAATATVTLPPIATALPAAGSTQNYNVGNQSLMITIKSLTGQVVNISCASAATETLNDTIVISSTNAFATLIASLTDKVWYKIA